MRRRTYLALGVGLTSSLTGCNGEIDGFSDGGSDDDPGPAETVEAYFDAVYAGDVDRANRYLHPNGSLPTLTESRIEERYEIEATTDATVVDSENGTATVEVEHTADTNEDGTWTAKETFELREDDGAWKLYARRHPGVAPSSPPSVQWDVEERSGDDGQVTGVRFTNAIGDAVHVASLRVVVGEQGTDPDGNGIVSAGETIVVPFTAQGGDYDAGTTVALQWESQTSDTSATLVEHDLESDTAGELPADFRIE